MPESRLPLEGIKVVDLSRLLPGSLCGQMLGDLGAEVLKVEDVERGDDFRWTQPRLKYFGSYFHMVNRNKLGMKLNLKHPRGREVFIRLVEKADILLETFRPGVMAKLGLGYECLQTINPRLIYCSLTGFGQDGPYRDRAAHDINFLSLSGVLDLIGERDGRPAVPAIQIAGVGGGALNACIGILAALYSRQVTGKGQYLDISILDGMTPFLSLAMAEYLTTGESPRRGATMVGGGYAFYNVYETADKRFLALGCLEPKFWSNFCTAIGKKELIEHQFTPPPDQDRVIKEVAEVIKTRRLKEWVEILSQHDVCFSPVNSLEEAFNDPHIAHRGLWFKAEHSLEGEVGQQGFPVRFSWGRPGWRRLAPTHGEHTVEVLKSLGYGEEEIAILVQEGII